MVKKQIQQIFFRTAWTSRKRPEAELVGGSVPEVKQSSQPISSPSPTKEQTTVKRSDARLSLSMIWGIIIVLLGGTGIVGGLLLTTLPPPPDCQKLSPLTSDSERLYCAQLAAESGNLDQLGASLEVIREWPSTHPLYGEAQRQMGEWSMTILEIARQQIDRGDLQAAINAIGKIPVNSPLYKEAQAKLDLWQNSWQQAEDITVQFQKALKAQKWGQAALLGQSLAEIKIDFWRSVRLNELMNQLGVEQQAVQQLQQARELAQLNTPEQLEQAIALAGRVSPNTYIAPTAKSQRRQWTRALLQIAANLFGFQNYDAAVSVAKRVPADSEFASVAQDWIHLSQAQATVQKNHVVAFIDALTAVSQINPSSPLYKQAQDRITVWQTQLVDNQKLLIAKTLASFEQPFTFQLAINQAKLINSKRPGYGEAQNLIANWQQTVQNISDRAALATAQQLAKPGTIEGLRAAVAQASQIQSGQSLHAQAKTSINQWTRQIQTIEDKPVLDLARAFAQNGNLISAVQTAQQIRPGRALYPDAQAALSDWVAQIQIAEDRPILQTANEFADQGSYEAAIQTASQISPGRPLYGQAQAAVAQWKAKLAPPATPVIPFSVTPSPERKSEVITPQLRRRSRSIEVNSETTTTEPTLRKRSRRIQSNSETTTTEPTLRKRSRQIQSNSETTTTEPTLRKRSRRIQSNSETTTTEPTLRKRSRRIQSNSETTTTEPTSRRKRSYEKQDTEATNQERTYTNKKRGRSSRNQNTATQQQ